MKKTSIWFKSVQSLLILAAASMASAQTNYTDNYCGMQGSKCITYTLTVTAPDEELGDKDGDRNWDADRVFVMINAEQCIVPIGSFGATMTVQGQKELGGSQSLRTPATLSWRVPANCPYHLHMRHKGGWLGGVLFGDDIYTHDIDSAKAQTNYCITWNLLDDKYSEGCP